MGAILDDSQLEQLRVLVDRIEQGVKRGRIPFGEATESLQSLEDKYAVVIEPDTIDCAAWPYIPEGLEFKSQIGGLAPFHWKPEGVELYVSEEQKVGIIQGHKLFQKLTTTLAPRKVCNANVLDYLLKNPHLIPDGWKGIRVFFWGTIYTNAYGSLCVRFLRWKGKTWTWNYEMLTSSFISEDMAAITSAE